MKIFDLVKPSNAKKFRINVLRIKPMVNFLSENISFPIKVNIRVELTEYWKKINLGYIANRVVYNMN